VPVNVEMEHGQSRHVDDTKTVGLSGDKVELGVGHLVDQSRFGNGFGTTGVEDGQVLLQHDGVLLMVPVYYFMKSGQVNIEIAQCASRISIENKTKQKKLTSKGNGILVIVLVGLVGVVDDEGTTKTIDVLTLEMSMDPVSTVLLNWDGVREVGTWRDGALSDHGRAIHLVVAGLEKTVRVQGRGLVNLVADVDDQGVVQGDVDGRDSIQEKLKEIKRNRTVRKSGGVSF